MIKIKDYYTYPGPRYCNQGEASGEEFYHRILNNAFANAYKDSEKLVVNLDDTAGYLSSFLDEAFGNLVFDFSLEIVQPRIKIVTTQEPDWEAMIENEVFQNWEKRRLDSNSPKKTIDHPEWFRFENRQLIKKVWI